MSKAFTYQYRKFASAILCEARSIKNVAKDETLDLLRPPSKLEKAFATSSPPDVPPLTSSSYLSA